jgi:hypothetical protein
MSRPDHFSALCDAEFWLAKSTDAALQALTLVGANQAASIYEQAMHKAFAKAAEALGYDLVIRTTAAEAAALVNQEAA